MPNKARGQGRQVTDQPLNHQDSRKAENAEADLKKSSQEREARRKGASLSTGAASPIDPDDRQILRGVNQEDEHHKRRRDD